MTEMSMALNELLEKREVAPDFLRETLSFMLEQLMEHEVAGLCGAGRHERSAERMNSRNGYRDRPLETRLGTVELKVPKLRQGSYFPGFLEPRRMSEKALTAVVQEAYVQGISTRKVDELVQAMGMTGISKSQVSRLCQEIDARVKAFLERPLTGRWPYLWLDATYIKSREHGPVASQAVVVATAVNAEGYREVLGLSVGPAESEAFWCEFLRSLKQRQLGGVRLVISDAHEGLKKAIATVFVGASWQRCRVHFMRNVLSQVPRAHQPRSRRRCVPPLPNRIRRRPSANGGRQPAACVSASPKPPAAWTAPRRTSWRLWLSRRSTGRRLPPPTDWSD